MTSRQRSAASSSLSWPVAAERALRAAVAVEGDLRRLGGVDPTTVRAAHDLVLVLRHAPAGLGLAPDVVAETAQTVWGSVARRLRAAVEETAMPLPPAFDETEEAIESLVLAAGVPAGPA